MNIINSDDKKVLVRWESKNGKYWVELYSTPQGYGYRSDNSGGWMGKVRFEMAEERCMQECGFCPVEMTRVD